MYSFGVTGRLSSSIAPASRQVLLDDAPRSFEAELSAALQSEISESDTEAATESESPFRKLTAIDKAVQRDIQAAFGIEPHKPGEPLRPLLGSIWTLRDNDKNGAISTDEMEANATVASDIFKEHLTKFMFNENVSSQPPIELSIGGNGMVRVQEGHPDKEKIENFINGNPELRNLYAGISSTHDFVALAEESLRFQKRYAVDPKAAVAEFSHLFSGHYGYTTRLTIDGENWNYQTTSSFSV